MGPGEKWPSCLAGSCTDTWGIELSVCTEAACNNWRVPYFARENNKLESWPWDLPSANRVTIYI